MPTLTANPTEDSAMADAAQDLLGKLVIIHLPDSIKWSGEIVSVDGNCVVLHNQPPGMAGIDYYVNLDYVVAISIRTGL